VVRQGIGATAESPIGYLYLGRIMMQQQAWSRAADAYREALTQYPAFEPAYLGLATALEAEGQTAQAIDTYRKILEEVNHGSREARQRLVRLLLLEKANRRRQQRHTILGLDG